MLHWCELCQAAPADGVLTIVRKGEVEPDYVQACNGCVRKLNEEDWLS